MSTTRKQTLIDRIAQNTHVKTVVVKVIIQNFFDEINAELAKGNRIEFRDFGVFEVRETAPRIAQKDWLPRSLSWTIKASTSARAT